MNPITQVPEDLHELEAIDMQDQSSAASAHDELQKFVSDNDIKTFKVGVVDLDGVWRGKRKWLKVQWLPMYQLKFRLKV